MDCRHLALFLTACSCGPTSAVSDVWFEVVGEPLRNPLAKENCNACNEADPPSNFYTKKIVMYGMITSFVSFLCEGKCSGPNFVSFF